MYVCWKSIGDQNQGSPMMPHGIRSQNPGMPNQMNSLPNNPAGMNNMRMGGPGGQVRFYRKFHHISFIKFKETKQR